MPLKVIGAGASRTGTLSLKLALEQLGLGPCHHFFELIRDRRAFDAWRRVFNGEAIDWDEVYLDYQSGVDAPTCWFWRALAARYPGAKVILTIREAQGWLRSSQQTIATEENFARLMQSPGAEVVAKAGAYLAAAGSSLDPTLAVRDPAAAISGYNRHNDEVRAAIPGDRLLVFDVKDGWGPLCAFLGVAVPASPFPRTNSSASFQDWVRTGRAPI